MQFSSKSQIAEASCNLTGITVSHDGLAQLLTVCHLPTHSVFQRFLSHKAGSFTVTSCGNLDHGFAAKCQICMLSMSSRVVRQIWHPCDSAALVKGTKLIQMQYRRKRSTKQHLVRDRFAMVEGPCYHAPRTWQGRKKRFDVCDGCEFRSHDLQCHKLTRFQLRQSVVA